MSALALVGAAIGAIGLVPSMAPATSIADDVVVAIQPATSEVTLGDDLEITIDVANRGGEQIRDLVVHIDVTALDESGSVDPEDWTSTLSQVVGDVGPGESASIDWRIQPISAGTFSLYAVALSADDDSVAASNRLQLSVDDQRSLNPNGILPIAIGAPSVIGALLVAQIRLARRQRPRPPT